MQCTARSNFILLLCFFFSSILFAAEPKKEFLMEALVARVGREPVALSDLMRFQHIERVMFCAGLRANAEPANSFDTVLSRYIEEDLIYIEAKAKKGAPPNMISDAVKVIVSKDSCQKYWKAMGKKYGGIWSSTGRPLEGESMLVRELEKRLLIDFFIKTQIQGDRFAWLREAKVKIPVKMYLE